MPDITLDMFLFVANDELPPRVDGGWVEGSTELFQLPGVNRGRNEKEMESRNQLRLKHLSSTIDREGSRHRCRSTEMASSRGSL
jgi:hypothetical protein